MQFFMVSVPGFLFWFLICMPNLVYAETETSVSRVVERNSVTEQGKKVCETWVLSSLEDFKGQQIFNSTQQCLETYYIIYNDKCRPIRKYQIYSFPVSYAFKKSCEEAIAIRRKARQPRSTVRTPPPTVRTWPPTVKTPPPTVRQPKVFPTKKPPIKEKGRTPSKSSMSCKGKILDAIDSTGMCDLLNRTTGNTIVKNVPCQDHTGCFMTNNLLCKNFQKGNWRISSFQRCDTDYRITRAVERGISKQGVKICKIMFEPSLKDFEGLQTFYRRSQCMNTYYVRNNNVCSPKQKKTINKDDVFYYLKKDCEDAITKK